MLKEINGINGTEMPDYLDISQILEGNIYTKIALVTSADAGTTKNNSGFARFFLKDVNANVVCARLFDVKDFASCGIKLSSYKNLPVELKFIAQEYNGSLSLVVDGEYGIRPYEGAIDLERFIGKVEYSSDQIEAVGKSIYGSGWEIKPQMRTISCSLGQGRVGAFMKVWDLALANLLGYTDLPYVKADELLKVFFNTIEVLFSREKNKNTFGIFNEVQDFDLLTAMNNKFHDDELRGQYLDAAKAVLGIAKPGHIYSHLVTAAIEQAITNLNLILVNSGMLTGTASWIGGVRLLKY